MNSSEAATSRSEVELLTPQLITRLSFSFSFATRGEKSLSPVSSAKMSMCCFA